jgi:hypothetical protein
MNTGKLHYTRDCNLWMAVTLCGRDAVKVGWVTVHLPARRPRRKPKDVCAICYRRMKK